MKYDAEINRLKKALEKDPDNYNLRAKLDQYEVSQFAHFCSLVASSNKLIEYKLRQSHHTRAEITYKDSGRKFVIVEAFDLYTLYDDNMKRVGMFSSIGSLSEYLVKEVEY